MESECKESPGTGDCKAPPGLMELVEGEFLKLWRSFDGEEHGHREWPCRGVRRTKAPADAPLCLWFSAELPTGSPYDMPAGKRDGGSVQKGQPSSMMNGGGRQSGQIDDIRPGVHRVSFKSVLANSSR